MTNQNDSVDTDIEFSLSKYFESLENKIQSILSRPEKNVLTYDILDTEKSKTNKLLVLKEKQRQMKVGEIWQEALGRRNRARQGFGCREIAHRFHVGSGRVSARAI